MLKVEFHELDSVAEEALAFAVIMARVSDKWLFVRHKQRSTWEVPGGHREAGEPILKAAARELQEETGATSFQLHSICEYSVTAEDHPASFGRLFFAEVTELGNLPDSEIGEVVLLDELPPQLTYPLIQPQLSNRVRAWLMDNDHGTACKEQF